MTLCNVAIKKIKIGDRIREEVGNLASLMRDIQEVGLLNPISLTPDFRLLAGYRRLQACRALGWENIPAQIISEARGEH